MELYVPDSSPPTPGRYWWTHRSPRGSALSDPPSSLLDAVDADTESRHRGHVRIESDGTEIVDQYLDLAAADPDQWATVERKVGFGELPSSTPLDVTASFNDGLEATTQHTLDWSDEDNGAAVHAQLEEVKPRIVRYYPTCDDEFPSDEASQGGLNRSWSSVELGL